MIVQSPIRQRTSQILAASFAQLTLPWLAPAQVRWMASHSSSGSTVRRSATRKRCNRIDQRCRLSSTAESSAAVSPEPATSMDPESIPWSWQVAPQSITNVRRDLLDTDRPARKRESLPPESETAAGLSEQLNLFHDALRLRHIQRAHSVIQSMIDMTSDSVPEVRYAYTLLFEEHLAALHLLPRASEQAKSALEKMEDLYQEIIARPGSVMDPQIMVYLLRAVMHTEIGEARDHKIRDYMQIIEGMDPEAQGDILLSSDYGKEELFVLGSSTANTKVLKEEDLGPNMLTTSQKGTSIWDTRSVLAPLYAKSALPAEMPEHERNALDMERQLQIEENSVAVAIDRWRASEKELRKIGIDTAMQSRPVTAMVWQWYNALAPLLETELKESQAALRSKYSSSDDRAKYCQYLEAIPIESIAAITILQVIGATLQARDAGETNVPAGSMTLARLTDSIARAVEEQAKTHAAAKMVDRSTGKVIRKPRTEHAAQQSASPQDDLANAHVDWPHALRLKLGSMLLSKLIEIATLPVTMEHPVTKEHITQLQPAYTHTTYYNRGRRFGALVPNKAFTMKLSNEPIFGLIAKRMPMIVEPRPWSGWQEGGYYLCTDTIIRTTRGDTSAKEYFAAAQKQGDLTKIYQGLNTLSKVPWRIHKDVFNVQLRIWNTGEALAGFAPANSDVPIPPEPAAGQDPKVRRAWLHEVREAENDKANMHSQRCFQNLQLEVARAMLNETIYFPHNLDFRGRAYPMSPYLNHMGADNARSLMMFANGKPLGAQGLRWLKIHLANVAGYDKASLQEREDFTMDHIDDIRDSATNPVDGRRWWLKSEDAWQTLAACFELINALDSPDPTAFVSHLPLHQDGTCNGLQHYAALGGDEAGALHVNLTPGDRPADIYTGVANSVIAAAKKDAENGNEIAKFLEGYISRKVVKQPVMTNVYGVTAFGAREQVHKQLKTLFPDVKNSDPISRGMMAGYISGKIFDSMGTMFEGAQAIQFWLGQCAELICNSLTAAQVERMVRNGFDEEDTTKKPKAKPLPKDPDVALRAKLETYFKSTVVWTTPLRLPVAQPYRMVKKVDIKTAMQTLKMPDPRSRDPVSKRRQLQAFPPNFIHSLDATHMMLSAMKCDELDITFASIHDSFWTHASDIPRMNGILRDAFVQMHSDDIIGRLREELAARYQGSMYLATIPATSSAGEQIKAWRKDNTNQREALDLTELKLEFERQALLQSADPEERAKGEAMVTPASILEAAGHSVTDTIPTIAPQPLAQRSVSNSQAVSALTDDNDQFEQSAAHDEQGDALESDEAEGDEEHPTGAAKNKKEIIRKLSVWRALIFPDVPKKGTFDVARLKDSQYFFH